MIEKVYILHHVHIFQDGSEDIKLIGVYRTKEDALKAIDDSKTLPGFKDSPDEFHIDEYKIGERAWSEGYITMF